MKIFFQSYFELYKKITKKVYKKIGLEMIIFLLVMSQFYIFIPKKYPIFSYTLDLDIYILFIIISLMLIYYFAYQKKSQKIKIVIISILIVIFASILSLAIYLRLQDNVKFIPHDGISQIEVSMDFLLAGQNPYSETFYGTIMDNLHDRVLWWESNGTFFWITNPALENVVYTPLSFLLPIPFKVIWQNITDWYDHRIFLFIFYIISLFIAYKLPDKDSLRWPLLLFFAFNPFLLHDILFGINDIVSICLALWSLYLLKQQKFKSSILLITISALIKQNMIFYWPFFLFYIFVKKKYRFNIKSILKFSKYFIYIIIPVLLVLLPFIIWSPSDYYHDTIYYLGHLYPIKGIGFSSILFNLNIIKSPFVYHPFWIYQIIFILVTLLILLKKQYYKNNIAKVYLYGSILMGGVWWLSRYFHESHANVVTTNIIIALFL